MRQLFLLSILISTLTFESRAQFPIHPDSLFRFIRYNSVYRDRVNWDSLNGNFQRKIKTSKTARDTMNAFVGVLDVLNDVHSQFSFNGENFSNYPVFADSLLPRLIALNNLCTRFTNQVLVRMLDRQTAYLRLPTIQISGQEAIDQMSQAVYDSLSGLLQRGPRGLILDLRLNGGGNVYPMLSGLSELLGPGIVAHETEPDGTVVRTWSIKRGNFFMDSFQMTHVRQRPVPSGTSQIPVAILLGPVTRSSGSITAIAFKYRPRTVFIGEPTADGYSTSNGYFVFAPNLQSNFSVHFVSDRKGQVYRTTVDPDVIIRKGEDFEQMQKDRCIEEARRWLRQVIARKKSK